MKIIITESQMKRLLDTIVTGDDQKPKKSSSIKKIVDGFTDTESKSTDKNPKIHPVK